MFKLFKFFSWNLLEQSAKFQWNHQNQENCITKFQGKRAILWIILKGQPYFWKKRVSRLHGLEETKKNLRRRD